MIVSIVTGRRRHKGTDPENFLDLALGVRDFNSYFKTGQSRCTGKNGCGRKNKFFCKDLQGYNVIAEIPGTDPVLKNEIVMIGAPGFLAGGNRRYR